MLLQHAALHAAAHQHGSPQALFAALWALCIPFLTPPTPLGLRAGRGLSWRGGWLRRHPWLTSWTMQRSATLVGWGCASVKALPKPLIIDVLALEEIGPQRPAPAVPTVLYCLVLLQARAWRGRTPWRTTSAAACTAPTPSWAPARCGRPAGRAATGTPQGVLFSVVLWNMSRSRPTSFFVLLALSPWE